MYLGDRDVVSGASQGNDRAAHFVYSIIGRRRMLLSAANGVGIACCQDVMLWVGVEYVSAVALAQT